MKLRAEGLVCTYGPTRALDGVDATVGIGEVLVVLGPNGAGKSTLLRALSGERAPEEGGVFFDGAPVSGTDATWRQRIGLVSHRTGLYRHLTVRENLTFFGKLHGVSSLDAAIVRSLEALGAMGLAEKLASKLSRGQGQRVALARALLHEPNVLFLDEPFTGLDHQGGKALQELLVGGLRAERAVVLVTHDLERGLACADRVLVLGNGQVVWAGVRGGGQDGHCSRGVDALAPELAPLVSWAEGRIGDGI